MADHIRIQFYLPKDQVKFLNELHRETLEPRAYFVREAIRLYAWKKRNLRLAPEPDK